MTFGFFWAYVEKIRLNKNFLSCTKEKKSYQTVIFTFHNLLKSLETRLTFVPFPRRKMITPSLFVCLEAKNLKNATKKLSLAENE